MSKNKNRPHTKSEHHHPKAEAAPHRRRAKAEHKTRRKRRRPTAKQLAALRAGRALRRRHHHRHHEKAAFERGRRRLRLAFRPATPREQALASTQAATVGELQAAYDEAKKNYHAIGSELHAAKGGNK